MAKIIKHVRASIVPLTLALAVFGLTSRAEAVPPVSTHEGGDCLYAGERYSQGSTRKSNETESHDQQGRARYKVYTCKDGKWTWDGTVSYILRPLLGTSKTTPRIK